MTDEDQIRIAFARAFERARPDDRCPTPDTLFAAFQLELEPAGRRQIVDHLAECPMCAEAWRILVLHRERSMP